MLTFRQFITEGALQKANLNKNPDRVERLNGETPTEDYEPMLMAIYKGKSRRDFQIEGARFSIYPRGGRKHVNI